MRQPTGKALIGDEQRRLHSEGSALVGQLFDSAGPERDVGWVVPIARGSSAVVQSASLPNRGFRAGAEVAGPSGMSATQHTRAQQIM